MRRRRPWLSHENTVGLTALWAGLPAALVALALLWTEPHSPKVRWTFSVGVVAALIGLSLSVRAQVVHPLRLVSALLTRLRERDYAVHVPGADWDDTLGAVYAAINELSPDLLDQRTEAIEAANLLAKLMAEIDVAVFAFDADNKLQFVNRGGQALFGRTSGLMRGATAAELGLADLLAGETPRTTTHAFASGQGPWEVRRRAFLQGGRGHQLLIIHHLGRALREEEQLAWQRILRVIGHEINNSLAPITSIASRLRYRVGKAGLTAENADDVLDGFALIQRRAEALTRFTSAYAKLARLPQPTLASVAVRDWVYRVIALEKRLPITVVEGPAVTISADGDQLDQLLINLVRNAADAAGPCDGGVTVTWTARPGRLQITVSDEGPGIGETNNLFVPFFTTKPDGSGIGLVLSRQIAEAHGGTLQLRNRSHGSGCEAILDLRR